MESRASCLISKLSHYYEMEQCEKDLLYKLEKNVQEYKSGSDIYREGEQLRYLHVVQSGWLYSHTDLPNGDRLVVRIHLPGDLIGLEDMPLKCNSVTLTSCTETNLCPFMKSDVDEILLQAPRLTALLFALTARDHVVLIDTLKAVSRMQSPSRIAYFLLDLVSRLRITNRDLGDQICVPLTQSVIGDATGLSNVSVSRTLSQMESEQLLLRSGDRITFLDEERLIALCDFENRYHSIDTSWFPDLPR